MREYYGRGLASTPFQLRLIVGHVESEHYSQDPRTVFLRAVVDDLLSHMAGCEKSEILQSTCNTMLTCHGFWKTCRYLEISDFPSALLGPQSAKIIEVSSFIVALASHHTEVQSKFFRDGIGINFPTEFFGFPLGVAARFGYFDTAALLLDSGADVNHDCYAFNRSALEIASWYGHTDVDKVLLDPKYNLDNLSYFSRDATWKAVKRKHPEIATMILNRNPNVDNAKRRDICMSAARHGYEDLVLQMLDAGVNANINGKVYDDIIHDKSDDSGTPIFEAAKNGHCSIVALLLDRGAEVEYYGHDAFLGAARAGQIKVLDLMLKRGVDMKVNDWMLEAFVGAA